MVIRRLISFTNNIDFKLVRLFDSHLFREIGPDHRTMNFSGESFIKINQNNKTLDMQRDNE